MNGTEEIVLNIAIRVLNNTYLTLDDIIFDEKMDSLRYLNLIVELEEAFGIEIEDEVLFSDQIESLRDLIEIISIN